MSEFFKGQNAGALYLLVGGVLAFVVAMCVIFMVKSYKAGLKIGMDKKTLRKIITSSATFTVLPSVSILLGVITIMKLLGVPFAWLRLSVIGSLQYELTAAGAAIDKIVGSGALDENGVMQQTMDMGQFGTVSMVMTVAILGGIVCCLFFLKPYLKKMASKPKTDANEGTETTKKPNFGEHATTAMFVGLCAAFIGSYIGKCFPQGGADFMPLLVALAAAAVMGVFEYFINKKNMSALENFSLAGLLNYFLSGRGLSFSENVIK